MPKLYRRVRKKAGTPPGTLVYQGEGPTDGIKISLIRYNEERFEENEPAAIEEAFPLGDGVSVAWLNVDGIHDPRVIERVGESLSVHSLVLEDILNTGQRPKLDEGEDYFYIVLKMLAYDEARDELESEQVSLLVGSDYVVSFQERVGDVFGPIRERLRQQRGRFRMRGADYLAYALIDVIVDNYFVILEKIGNRIEEMDERIISDPSPAALREIRALKRDMIFLRKSIWPLREVIGTLGRSDSNLIHEPTRIYLRDVYDHTIQVIDTIEALREMIVSILDIYLSSVSNRMNDVMKVLTIIATIFIPLTFVAGIYGMNFDFMPELHLRWAYPATLGVMAVIALGMLIFFRRRKWI